MTQELQSVKNTLLILKCFTVEKSKWRVTELSKQTGLSKSAVSRTLNTLANEGFVRKAKDQQSYLLGLSLLTLAGVALSSITIQQELSPILSQLVVKTNESGHIAVLDDWEIIYIFKEESASHTKMKTHLGRRNPAHATSSGKLLLAFQDPSPLDKLSERTLTAYTPSTIVNPLQFAEELGKIRQAGFAYSKDELTVGVSSLAVPVRDYTETVVASISLVGDSQRLNPQKVQQLVPLLKKAAKDSSRRIGFWN